MLVVRVPADVADEQHRGLLAEVLPPVRGADDFWAISPALCRIGAGAVAGVFDDLALGDVDQRRAVVMAVPRHDPAGLDHELAEAQLAALDLRRLLFEIDGAERRIGDACGLRISPSRARRA